MDVVEAPFVRVPFEALKRAAKERKYIVEEVEKVMSEIRKQAKGEGEGVEGEPSTSPNQEGEKEKDWESSIDVMLDTLGGLKRKLDESARTESVHINRCKARVEHLMSLGAYGTERALNWNKRRMKRLVVDYLLRQGYHNAALEAIEGEKDLGYLVELEIFQSALEIVVSLKNRDCSAALRWCGKHRAKLKKIKSKLEFKLRIREFICLVQEGKVSDAVKYSQKHLSQWASSHMVELQQAMATLVYGPLFQQYYKRKREMNGTSGGRGEGGSAAMDDDDDSETNAKDPQQEHAMMEIDQRGGESNNRNRNGNRNEMVVTQLRRSASAKETAKETQRRERESHAGHPANHYHYYSHLFEDSQWDELVQIFKREMYQLYMLPADSNLAIHIQAGLSALKTPMSYTNSCSKEDPLSLEAFRKLSEKLPYAKHSKSRLVCHITKQVMNEHNPPMVLPNGMCYSRAACEELAEKSGTKKIVCPRTGDVCDFSELKRAYPV